MQLHFCRFQVRRRITIISIYYRFGLTIVPLRFFLASKQKKGKMSMKMLEIFFLSNLTIQINVALWSLEHALSMPMLEM